MVGWGEHAGTLALRLATSAGGGHRWVTVRLARLAKSDVTVPLSAGHGDVTAPSEWSDNLPKWSCVISQRQLIALH